MPGDDKEQITEEILSFADRGADLIVCTGGMSVDPDDRTPGGIRDTGAEDCDIRSTGTSGGNASGCIS